MATNIRVQKFIILAIYITALFCSSYEEVISLSINREADYINEGRDICFNHNIINPDGSIGKILEIFCSYNKILFNNVRNTNYSLHNSLKITREIALPIKIQKPNKSLRSITVIKLFCYEVTFNGQCDIFRPPKLRESSSV